MQQDSDKVFVKTAARPESDSVGEQIPRGRKRAETRADDGFVVLAEDCFEQPFFGRGEYAIEIRR